MRVRLALQLEDKASGAAHWLFQLSSFSLHMLFVEEDSGGTHQREKICMVMEAVGYSIGQLGISQCVCCWTTADWYLSVTVWPKFELMFMNAMCEMTAKPQVSRRSVRTATSWSTSLHCAQIELFLTTGVGCKIIIKKWRMPRVLSAQSI